MKYLGQANSSFNSRQAKLFTILFKEFDTPIIEFIVEFQRFQKINNIFRLIKFRGTSTRFLFQYF